jgi:hypothetical protein
MLRYPFAKQGETKLPVLHCLHHELICGLAAYIQIEAVQQQESMHRRKADAFIAVQKSVIVHKRLEQRGSFFGQVVVITSLRTKNGSFQSALIAQPVQAAVFFRSDDAGWRRLRPPSGRRARPLLGEPLVELTVFLVRTPIGSHNFRPNQSL